MKTFSKTTFGGNFLKKPFETLKPIPQAYTTAWKLVPDQISGQAHEAAHSFYVVDKSGFKDKLLFGTEDPTAWNPAWIRFHPDHPDRSKTRLKE